MIIFLYSECSLAQWTTSFVLFLKCRYITWPTLCPLASSFLSGFRWHPPMLALVAFVTIVWVTLLLMPVLSCRTAYLWIVFVLQFCHSFMCIGLCQLRMIAKHLGIRIAVLTSGHGPCPHLGPPAESQRGLILSLYRFSLYRTCRRSSRVEGTHTLSIRDKPLVTLLKIENLRLNFYDNQTGE